MHPRSSICALLSLSAILCSPLCAQTHKVDAPDKVTRAIGVYEWTGNLPKPTAARLIPISLFINGHFQDAGVYLAQPVPFVLQTGDVYSIERAGQSIGTLDLEYARNIVTRRSVSDDNPLGAWYGYGRFLTLAQEAKATALHAIKPPVVIASTDSDTDDRPHFIRRQASATSTTPSSSTKPTAPTTTNPAPDYDPDRPTLRHRDPADATESKKDSKKELGYVTPPNTSLNDDPNRPILRRGVPADAVTTTQLIGTPPNLHQAVAVSDPVDRDPHLFTREWATSTERADTLAALEALAQPLLAEYIATNKLDPSSAATSSTTPPKRPVHPTHTAHSRTKKVAAPPPVPLVNEDVHGYTLSYDGLPTFVYSAETPIPDGGPVYLTLVAQRPPSGKLQVALSSVTDATHLDRTPWFRLVDVVDPDWSHRGSLLFELRAQSSRQFALYRLVTPQAERTFVTGIIE